MVEANEMDQGEGVSREEKMARKEPQSTSTFRKWKQKEESTSEAQKVPERRNKIMGFRNLESKRMLQAGRKRPTE